MLSMAIRSSWWKLASPAGDDCVKGHDETGDCPEIRRTQWERPAYLLYLARTELITNHSRQSPVVFSDPYGESRRVAAGTFFVTG